MPRWSRSNPLALAVLVCLYEKPMHPYEVAQTLRTRAKEQSVRLNYGSLYAVVESLEKKGFIKATGTLREGKRPQRTIYEITEEGSLEMTDWLTELIGTPEQGVPGLHGRPLLPARARSRRRPGRAPPPRRGADHEARRHARRHAGGTRRRPAPHLRARVRVRGAHAQPPSSRSSRALVEEMENGTLEGLELWRLFQTEDFNPEEVHFTFDLPKE